VAPLRRGRSIAYSIAIAMAMAGIVGIDDDS
jgi:hypothetical protein